MNSYTEPCIYGFEAGASLTGKEHTFLKFGASEKELISAAAGEKAIGVLASGNRVVGSEINSGDEIEAAILGGGALLKLAGTVSAGDSIASNADGEGVVATTGQWSAAIAMKDGVAGDIIPVILDGHFQP